MNHSSKYNSVYWHQLYLSRKCKVSCWVEYVSCVQYFIQPILLWAYCALLHFHIEFKMVFNFSAEEKELFPALNAPMLHCTLKSSQTLDVLIILREVSRILREQYQGENAIPFFMSTFFYLLFFSICTYVLLRYFGVVDWHTAAHFL